MEAILKMKINGKIKLKRHFKQLIEIPYIVDIWKDSLIGLMFENDTWEIYYTVESDFKSKSKLHEK